MERPRYTPFLCVMSCVFRRIRAGVAPYDRQLETHPSGIRENVAFWPKSLLDIERVFSIAQAPAPRKSLRHYLKIPPNPAPPAPLPRYRPTLVL